MSSRRKHTGFKNKFVDKHFIIFKNHFPGKQSTCGVRTGANQKKIDKTQLILNLKKCNLSLEQSLRGTSWPQDHFLTSLRACLLPNTCGPLDVACALATPLALGLVTAFGAILQAEVNGDRRVERRREIELGSEPRSETSDRFEPS